MVAEVAFLIPPPIERGLQKKAVGGNHGPRTKLCGLPGTSWPIRKQRPEADLDSGSINGIHLIAR